MKVFTGNKDYQIKRALLVGAFWLFIWQGIYWLVGQDLLVPSPVQTLRAVVSLTLDMNFYLNIGATLYRVIVGVCVSFGIGLLTALLAYYSELTKAILQPFMNLLKSTPVMAVIILAILWFTKNEVPIFVCFLMCYPIVYTNILKGLESLDQELLEVAKVFRVRRTYILKDLYLPQLKSYIEAALSMTAGLAWKVIIAAEVLAVPKYSMGYPLLNAKSYLETDLLFAWVVVIVLLSSFCEKLFVGFMKRKEK